LVEWTGNLKDDCRAELRGVNMHCEEMDRNYWWWAIYDSEHNELDSSNNYLEKVKNGKQARALAEKAVSRYLEE